MSFISHFLFFIVFSRKSCTLSSITHRWSTRGLALALVAALEPGNVRDKRVLSNFLYVCPLFWGHQATRKRQKTPFLSGSKSTRRILVFGPLSAAEATVRESMDGRNVANQCPNSESRSLKRFASQLRSSRAPKSSEFCACLYSK